MMLCVRSAVILFLLATSFSQQLFKESLIELGFENVYIENKNNKTILFYENRLYRSELTAMNAILNKIEKEVDSSNSSSVELVPMNQGISIASVSLSRDSNSWSLGNINIVPSYLSNSPENVSTSFLPVAANWRENPSFGKLNLTLIPDIRCDFHTPDGLVRVKLSAITEASVSLAKGLTFYSQLMVPIYYQFDSELFEPKPGSNYLNYTMKFKNDYWLSISGGMFHWKSGNYRDQSTGEFLGKHEWYRYGFSVESVKYFSDKRFKLFFKLDQTGHLSYKNSMWYYSSISDRLTWLSGFGYRFSYPDVYAQISFGQDLYTDTPLEFNLVRSFGELDLGFFVTWDKDDNFSAYSGGASFSVPLPYFNHKMKNIFLSTQKRFDWFVWYHSGFGGRYPKTKNSIDKYQKRLYQSYIENNKHLIEGAN